MSDPRGGVSGSPFSFGGAGVPAAPPGLWEPCMTMECLSGLHQQDVWRIFCNMLRKELNTGARQALAFHTTTACQPQKAAGPAGSLAACGLDDDRRRQDQQAGQWQHHRELKLPASYEAGDNLALEYKSLTFTTAKEAKGETCVELLAFLLINAPKKKS